ncbi:hypothetical protein SLA2020_067260 [Shorea laevis]
MLIDQKLHVCDICGAFLSVYNSDRHLVDHFGGKLHLDYMQIRDKLAELQRNNSCKLDRYDDKRSRYRDRYNDRERDRDYECSCTYDSRSRHRSRSRFRGRSRDHDRHR